MLGSIWLWWRLTSASFLVALITGSLSLGAAFVLFMVLKVDMAAAPFHAGLYISGLFLLVFVIGSMTLAECLRTDEKVAPRWVHVVKAVITVAAVVILLELAKVAGETYSRVPWWLLAVPVYSWRAHPFLEHPYVRSNFLVRLWRHAQPPASIS